MIAATLLHDLDHRSPWVRLTAILSVGAGIVVFGWSIRLPAFITFSVAAGILGVFDWRQTSALRLIAGWCMALCGVLILGAEVVEDGAIGILAPLVGAAIAAGVIFGVRGFYPAGIDLNDVVAGSFAAFALTSFGWRAPVIAFVSATAVGGALAGGQILRNRSAADVTVPFAALLAATSVITALGAG